mgnify:CR=1 FL=1
MTQMGLVVTKAVLAAMEVKEREVIHRAKWRARKTPAQAAKGRAARERGRRIGGARRRTKEAKVSLKALMRRLNPTSRVPAASRASRTRTLAVLEARMPTRRTRLILRPEGRMRGIFA